MKRVLFALAFVVLRNAIGMLFASLNPAQHTGAIRIAGDDNSRACSDRDVSTFRRQTKEEWLR